MYLKAIESVFSDFAPVVFFRLAVMSSTLAPSWNMGPKFKQEDGYPLVNVYITERSTIFNGKTHDNWPFSIANC